jgi:hypothetical protein
MQETKLTGLNRRIDDGNARGPRGDHLIPSWWCRLLKRFKRSHSMRVRIAARCHGDWLINRNRGAGKCLNTRQLTYSITARS